MEQKSIKVAIVDDHKVVREGLVSLLNDFEAIEVIGEAGDGQSALQLIRQRNVFPVVVLLDINMPIMGGIETAKKLHEEFPQKVKILALSMMHKGAYIRQMLAAGASGYVLKNCNKEELFTAIQKVAEDGTYFSNEVTKEVMRYMVSKDDGGNGGYSQLSKREMEVLKLIMEDKSNKEIADLLFISTRTVESHKQNLIAKTGVNSVAGLVVYAIKHNIFDDL